MIITLYLVTSKGRAGVSNICLTCSMFAMAQVYLVNVPRGKASFLTKAVVEFGSRFFLLPIEILSRRQSKNTWRQEVGAEQVRW